MAAAACQGRHASMLHAWRDDGHSGQLPAVPLPGRSVGRRSTGHNARSASPRCRVAGGEPAAVVSGNSDVSFGPDLELSVSGTNATIHVFGIDHRNANPHVGEFILRMRPEVVAVETAVTREHGAFPGNSLGCGDPVVEGTPDAFFVRMFCQIAAHLSEHGGADLAASELWAQITSHYRGEQLAYIAAFATGARLTFADRPKDISYRRLFAIASAADLDIGFASQVEGAYRESLGLPPPPYPGLDMPVAERIMFQERDAIICKVLDDLCRGSLAQGGPASPASSVVLVVGRSHLDGLRFLWAEQRWQGLVGAAALSDSQLMSVPQPPKEDVASRGAGVRRGLLHAMMRQMVTQEVMADMANVLGPVPQPQLQAVDAIEEIYTCNRMMLAALPPELLKEVVAGFNCDFEDVLAPYRDIRAVNGGCVYSEEIVTQLRSLNFELAPPEAAGAA
uniref:Uncharacterized protein n=1 Tax=Chlamydomonas euryale TaxID=1486919 RepID=A0A7R9V4Q4_9CHLO